MADGRSRALWSHTSHVLALLANVHRDPKARPEPFGADEFNPHAKQDRPPAPRVPLRDLKGFLTGIKVRRKS